MRKPVGILAVVAGVGVATVVLKFLFGLGWAQSALLCLILGGLLLLALFNSRMRAVFALRRAGTPAALQALESLSSEPDQTIATAARNGLRAASSRPR